MDILMTRFRRFSATFSFLIILMSSARAQLSPGDLHRTHKDLEGIENCTICHERGEKLSTVKCLKCHQVLKEEIEQKRGLHSNAAYRLCADCHIEHHGRDFDLIYWKEGFEKFDHAQTGYTLEGKHKTLKCRDCHKSTFIQNPARLKKAGKDTDKTFLGLSENCLSCHTDEHRGQLGKKCLSCHDMQGWKPAPDFNHNKTKFPLTGKHRGTACKKCHLPVTKKNNRKDKTYLKMSGLAFKTCVSCHQDVHSGKLGSNCNSCHSTKSWQKTKKKFDHTQTAFPLKGLHAKLECKACHLAGKPLKITRYKFCSDCHSSFHKGQFSKRLAGKDCSFCHDTGGFQKTNFTFFMHSKSSFPLKGAHQAVPCLACHNKTINKSKTISIKFQFNSVRCQNCHNSVHRNEEDNFLAQYALADSNRNCTYCHTNQSWNVLKFDHTKVGFPLEGRHSKTACTACHKPVKKNLKMIFIPFKINKHNCSDCHNDIHRKQFAELNSQTRCARCHVPSAWKNLLFDHNRDSRFKLDGAHKKTSCIQCHKKQQDENGYFLRYKPLKTSCVSCHGNK